MAKCINCGKSTIARGHVKLKDGAICTKCFLGFGYKLTDTARAASLTYSEVSRQESAEDLLERKAAEFDQRRSDELDLHFSNYGQARELNASEADLELYETICELLEDEDRDAGALELVRKSDDYLTIALGPTDVVRFKFTDRVKWITLPYNQVNKLRISGTRELNSIAGELVKAYDLANDINQKV